jgi:hypothetical protein
MILEIKRHYEETRVLFEQLTDKDLKAEPVPTSYNNATSKRNEMYGVYFCIKTREEVEQCYHCKTIAHT